MADTKISDLAAHTTMLATDLVPVVDMTTGATKKITFANFTTRAHASLSDSNTKTVASTSAEYAITFDSNDELVAITHTVGDSKVYAPVTGSYLLAISAVIDSTNNVTCLLDLWLKVNGQNVAKSNTQVALNSQNLQQVLDDLPD